MLCHARCKNCCEHRTALISSRARVWPRRGVLRVDSAPLDRSESDDSVEHPAAQRSTPSGGQLVHHRPLHHGFRACR